MLKGGDVEGRGRLYEFWEGLRKVDYVKPLVEGGGCIAWRHKKSGVQKNFNTVK